MVEMIITIKRREGVSHEEFVRRQRDVHRSLFLSIPEARRCIRRFVVIFPAPAPSFPDAD